MLVSRIVDFIFSALFKNQMMLKLAVLSLILALTGATLIKSKSAEQKHPETISTKANLEDAPIVPPVSFEQMHGLEGANHSMILGRRQYGDSLLHIDVAKKSWKFFRIVETDIIFPSARNSNKKIINYLQVLDRKANGHGGWPYLTQGGIGSKNVTIHFKSERSHGFDFIVYIYGHD